MKIPGGQEHHQATGKCIQTLEWIEVTETGKSSQMNANHIK